MLQSPPLYGDASPRPWLRLTPRCSRGRGRTCDLLSRGLGSQLRAYYGCDYMRCRSLLLLCLTELRDFPLQVLDSTPRGNDRGDLCFVPYTGMPSLASHPSAFLSLFTMRSLLFLAVRFRPHRPFLCRRCESTFLISVVHLGVHLIGSRLPLVNQPSSQAAVRVVKVLSEFRPFAGGRRRYISCQRRFTSAPVNCRRLFAPLFMSNSPRRLRIVLSLIDPSPSPRMRHTSLIEPFQSSGMSGQVFRRFIVLFFNHFCDIHCVAVLPVVGYPAAQTVAFILVGLNTLVECCLSSVDEFLAVRGHIQNGAIPGNALAKSSSTFLPINIAS